MDTDVEGGVDGRDGRDTWLLLFLARGPIISGWGACRGRGCTTDSGSSTRLVLSRYEYSAGAEKGCSSVEGTKATGPGVGGNGRAFSLVFDVAVPAVGKGVVACESEPSCVVRGRGAERSEVLLLKWPQRSAGTEGRGRRVGILVRDSVFGKVAEDVL